MKTRKLVDEFLISLRAKGDRPKTLTWYNSIVGRLAKTYKDLPEDIQGIEGFLGSLAIGAESRRSTIRALRAFYAWAKLRHNVTNPMLEVRSIHPRRRSIYYLSTVELAWLLALPSSSRDKTLIWLLVDTGIRIGEALSLNRQDIYDDYIMVTGKTGEREVPVSPEVRAQPAAAGPAAACFLWHQGRARPDRRLSPGQEGAAPGRYPGQEVGPAHPAAYLRPAVYPGGRRPGLPAADPGPCQH